MEWVCRSRIIRPVPGSQQALPLGIELPVEAVQAAGVVDHHIGPGGAFLVGKLGGDALAHGRFVQPVARHGALDGNLRVGEHHPDLVQPVGPAGFEQDGRLHDGDAAGTRRLDLLPGQASDFRPDDVGELLHLRWLAEHLLAEGPAVDAAVLFHHILTEGLRDRIEGCGARLVGPVPEPVAVDDPGAEAFEMLHGGGLAGGDAAGQADEGRTGRVQTGESLGKFGSRFSCRALRPSLPSGPRKPSISRAVDVS